MRRPPAWLVFLAAGMLASAGYFMLPEGRRNLAMVLIGLTGVVAIVVAISAYRPPRPLVWWLMALGQFVILGGDVLGMLYEEVLGRASPFPSLADGVHLVGYLPVIAALVLVVRRRQPGAGATGLIDASIVTVAIGVVLWVILGVPRPEEPNVLAVIVVVVYPMADLVLIALAVQLLLISPTRAPALALITLSLIALIFADLGYAFVNLHDVYFTGHPIDALWLLSYVTWAGAALHPSMRGLAEPGRLRGAGRLTRGRLVALGAGALALPVMLGIQSWRGTLEQVEVMAAGSGLVFLLVLARLAGLTTALEAATLHDPLTGLPNRRLMVDRLAQAVERYRRSSVPVAVLFCDLDGFKALNDRLGHAAGDDVLMEVGNRLRAAIRAPDTVARIGGDEFVAICEGVDEPEARRIAERMAASVEQPMTIGSRQVRLTLAIGVAVARQDVQGAEELLAEADQAMYRRKAESEAERTFFDIPRELDDGN